MTKKKLTIKMFIFLIAVTILCWFLIVCDAIALVNDSREWWEIANFVMQLGLGILFLFWIFKTAPKIKDDRKRNT